MALRPAERGSLAAQDQGRAERAGDRADHQQSAVALRGGAPQAMFQRGGSSPPPCLRSVEHHQSEGARGGELLGGPGRLARVIRTNEEQLFSLSQIDPVEGLQAPRAIDDGHTSALREAVVHNRAQQGGPAHTVLTDPGGDGSQGEPAVEELVDGRDARRQTRGALERLGLAPGDRLRVPRRDLSSEGVERCGGRCHTEHMNRAWREDQASGAITSETRGD